MYLGLLELPQSAGWYLLEFTNWRNSRKKGNTFLSIADQGIQQTLENNIDDYCLLL